MRWQIYRSISKSGIRGSVVRNDVKYLNFPLSVLLAMHGLIQWNINVARTHLHGYLPFSFTMSK